jgi:hypothetical protein
MVNQRHYRMQAAEANPCFYRTSATLEQIVHGQYSWGVERRTPQREQLFIAF